MTFKVIIQEAPFDRALEEEAVVKISCDAGALVTFQGMVRAFDEAKPLEFLFLEHFPIVTEKEITRIVEEARVRFAISSGTVIHRVGKLAINEPIVMVAIAAKHRIDAFSAAEFIMDYLKTEAPFWKKEIFNDGESHWVDAKESDETLKNRWITNG